MKNKITSWDQERARTTETIAGLQAKSESLQAERDALALKVDAAPTTESQNVLTEQIDTLIREKAALEKSLAEATAVNVTGAAQEEVNAEIVSVIFVALDTSVDISSGPLEERSWTFDRREGCCTGFSRRRGSNCYPCCHQCLYR
jgi:hypothetical protein